MFYPFHAGGLTIFSLSTSVFHVVVIVFPSAGYITTETVQQMAAMGATESGALGQTHLTALEDWAYVCFEPSKGIRWIQHTEDTFELWLVRMCGVG